MFLKEIREKAITRKLVKHPYLAEWSSVIYKPADRNTVTDAVIAVPGLSSGDLIWNVNQNDGGYSLHGLSGELYSRPDGSLRWV